jgi:hypothetical protein
LLILKDFVFCSKGNQSVTSSANQGLGAAMHIFSTKLSTDNVGKQPDFAQPQLAPGSFAMQQAQKRLQARR